MIVPTSVKVGLAGFLKNLFEFDSERFFCALPEWCNCLLGLFALLSTVDGPELVGRFVTDGA